MFKMESKPDYPVVKFEGKIKFDGKYSYKIPVPADIIRNMELSQGDRVIIIMQKEEVIQ
jgi:hypothetical protein